MRRAILFSVFALLLLWAFLAAILPEGAMPLLPSATAAVRRFFSTGPDGSGIRWNSWPAILASVILFFAIVPPLIAYLRSWPVLRRAVPIDDPIWATLLRDLSTQLNLSRRPTLLIHPEPMRPTTFGFLRPRIVLPCDCHAWAPSHRRVILLYELMRVVRRDLRAQRFSALLNACGWLRPSCWRSFRLLRRKNGQYVLCLRKPSSSAAIPDLTAAGAHDLPVPAFTAPLRVDSAGERLKRTRDVSPIYPAAAKSAGIQGAVSFEMVISSEGEPLDIRLLSSPDAGLTESALEAIRQWRYEPTLLNGQPVEIITDVTVSYKNEADPQS
jgi:TonB family protein